MKDEAMSPIFPAPADNKVNKRIPQLICPIVTYSAFAVIVLLAIPTCLLIAAIGGVWSLTDKIVRALENAAE